MTYLYNYSIWQRLFLKDPDASCVRMCEATSTHVSFHGKVTWHSLLEDNLAINAKKNYKYFFGLVIQFLRHSQEIIKNVHKNSSEKNVKGNWLNFGTALLWNANQP